MLRQARAAFTASEAAAGDLAGALARIADLRDPAEREAWIGGVFDWLAASKAPAEALAAAMALQGGDQWTALHTVVDRWTGKADRRTEPSSRGAVADQSERLLREKNVPRSIADAWLAFFANHPSRADIAAAYAGRFLPEDPRRALALADGFSPWERGQFLGEALHTWVAHDPKAALAWSNDPANKVPDSAKNRLLTVMAEFSPDETQQHLDSLSDPAARQAVIRAMAAVRAEQGTREAVAWADGLANPAERDAAHEVIYENTPRGIGVVLSGQNGFAVVGNVMPDSAAAEAGLQPGDRIVAAEKPDGTFADLHGAPLETAIGQLRGEPGTTGRLRVLRTGEYGQVSEVTLSITRRQIVLPPPDK